MGLKNKGGSQFAGLRGAFCFRFVGVTFSRGVWIYMKQKPSADIGSTNFQRNWPATGEFYLTLIVNFQKKSPAFSENAGETKMCKICPFKRGVVGVSGYRGEDFTRGSGNSGGLRPPSELCAAACTVCTTSLAALRASLLCSPPPFKNPGHALNERENSIFCLYVGLITWQMVNLPIKNFLTKISRDIFDR